MPGAPVRCSSTSQVAARGRPSARTRSTRRRWAAARTPRARRARAAWRSPCAARSICVVDRPCCAFSGVSIGGGGGPVEMLGPDAARQRAVLADRSRPCATCRCCDRLSCSSACARACPCAGRGRGGQSWRRTTVGQREVGIVEGEVRFEQPLGQPVPAALRRPLLVVMLDHLAAIGEAAEEQIRARRPPPAGR